jgi:outer membrane protein assembly factor BamA
MRKTFICFLLLTLSLNAQKIEPIQNLQDSVSFNTPIQKYTNPKSTPNTLKTNEPSILHKPIINTGRSKTIKILAFPFEYILQPTLDFLVEPLVPPVDYIFQEDVIGKGIEFITFGKQREIRIYPILDYNETSESSFGLSYEHRNIFFQNKDNLTLSASKMLNSDQRMNSTYSYLWTNTLSSRLKYSNQSYQSIIQNSTISKAQLYYSDSSWFSSLDLGLNLPFGLSSRVTANLNRIYNDTLGVKYGDDWTNLLLERGVGDKFYYWPISVSLAYNSKETPYSSTKGMSTQLSLTRGFVQRFGDYWNLDWSLQHYLLMGDKYSISKEEHKANLKYLQHFNIDKISELLDPAGFQERFLERKVLVNYISIKQSFDADENQKMAFIGQNSLGRATPLRAYPAARFINNSIMSWTCEYRWPLLLQVDGVLFNEYGTHYASILNLKNPSSLPIFNSWGFGFRVRNDDLFILRASLAFHGLSSPGVIITIRPEF